MDQYNESGFDPEVKQYFKKIMRSFAAGILWLLGIGGLGLFTKLAIVKGSLRWQNIAYYGVFIVSLIALIFYLRKLWREKPEN